MADLRLIGAPSLPLSQVNAGLKREGKDCAWNRTMLRTN